MMMTTWNHQRLGLIDLSHQNKGPDGEAPESGSSAPRGKEVMWQRSDRSFQDLEPQE